MRAITKLLGAVAAVAISSAAAGSAQSAIYIGLQQDGVNGGALTTVALGSFFANYSAGYGTFELELITGTEGVSPTILGSTTSDNNFASTGGTLNVYVTRTDIGGGVPWNLLSTFTSNALPTGWTMSEATYIDTNNGTYGGTLLSSHDFATIGTFTHNEFTGGGLGPYSVTTKYTVNATSTGNAFSTISIHAGAVPEPATWALMIGGFGGAGVMLRSRRRQAVAA